MPREQIEDYYSYTESEDESEGEDNLYGLPKSLDLGTGE
jgi:hypothetical protein